MLNTSSTIKCFACKSGKLLLEKDAFNVILAKFYSEENMSKASPLYEVLFKNFVKKHAMYLYAKIHAHLPSTYESIVGYDRAVNFALIEARIKELANLALKPIYQHDCNNCDYLGSDISEFGNPYDMYVCFSREFNEHTLLIRRSDEPGNYSSYDNFHIESIIRDNRNKKITGFDQAYKLINEKYFKDKVK